MRWLHVVLMLALLLPAAPALARDGNEPPVREIGVFEPTDCFSELPADTVPGEDIVCGYVTVPERHADPDGPTIRLAVAVIKSTSAAPAPDPLVIESGGPGYPSLLSVPGALNMRDFRAERDIVIVEQRGIGDSEPELTCDEGRILLREMYGQNPSMEQVIALEQEVLTTCRMRWIARGVDLSAYNSLEIAADFPLVMTALGYDTFNFYGISYASALAQHLMRDYPDRLRSVILDAVVPLGVSFVARAPYTTSRAFHQLFDQCAADPVCSEHFPDLETVFFDLVAQYDAQPVMTEIDDPWGPGTIETVITGDFLIMGLYQQLYWGRSIALLPASIYALAAGNPHFITEYVEPSRFSSLSVASGMYNSVMCSEFVDMADAGDPGSIYPQVNDTMQRYLDHPHLCAVWQVEPLPAGVHAPVVSDIPTLVLSGEYDPITPAEYGTLVAAHLPNSYVYTVPGSGHGSMGSSACGFSIALQFLTDPTRAPDTACLESMGVTFVASLDSADVTLEPVTVETYGLRAVAPSGWTEVEAGVYLSPGGESVLVLYREDDWEAALEGLDVQQVVGSLDVNGTIWTQYDVRFQGYYGTAALTTLTDQVYIVIVFHAEPDHEHLITHVWMPALEAFAVVP